MTLIRQNSKSYSWHDENRHTPFGKDHDADGFWFYENQEAGLGSYFRNSILSDIRSLKLYAGIHEVHFGKYYRLVSRTFPYSIFYRIEGSEIRVYAVLDSRRDPDLISDRLN